MSFCLTDYYLSPSRKNLSDQDPKINKIGRRKTASCGFEKIAQNNRASVSVGLRDDSSGGQALF
jgi:hypothetical protein